MKASNIAPGMVLRLKPNRADAYGLPRDSEWRVSSIGQRDGYLTPWIYVESHRPEPGVLPFKPSDFAKAVA